ncbi:hypothetical protein AMATHDRAFT_171530 [Amanita thiersii Skay4041]|uniref:Uncharacterized protein n=1 Tax=Amanita thiersii Skay4041 TaxID=703135 RepID=A0A2A9NZU5_9AGAR|nr:hypothetical protein AMATHDRAFT_171530 [Amanita thiersii Skay4041]
MDDSSCTDSDTSFLPSSVSSVLGINGPLRFRPHGSNQKAHVVLRRIILSDESSDDGDISNVVRFSLFAQKRIEVKPGKEILLAVASEDGRFKDLPLVFEGDPPSAETFDESANLPIIEDEKRVSFHPPVSHTVPPRIRRAWTKKLEVSPHIQESTPDLPSVLHASVAVQVEPLYTSRSTQALETPGAVIAKAYATSGVGNFPETSLSRPRISTAVQASDVRRYVNSEVQTDPEGPGVSLSVTDKIGPHTGSTTYREVDRERSLSPMELDSSPSSPEVSPPVFPKLIEDVSAVATPLNIPLPPSPTSSIASSSGAQDMLMSPVDSRPSSSIKILEQMPSSSVKNRSDTDKPRVAGASKLLQPNLGTEVDSLQLPVPYPVTTSVLKPTPSQASVRMNGASTFHPRPQSYQSNTPSSPMVAFGSQFAETSLTAPASNVPVHPPGPEPEYSPRNALFTSVSQPLTSSLSEVHWMPDLGHTVSYVPPGRSSPNAIASSSKVMLEQTTNSYGTGSSGGSASTTKYIDVHDTSRSSSRLSSRAQEKAPVPSIYHHNAGVGRHQTLPHVSFPNTSPAPVAISELPTSGYPRSNAVISDTYLPRRPSDSTGRSYGRTCANTPFQPLSSNIAQGTPVQLPGFINPPTSHYQTNINGSSIIKHHEQRRKSRSKSPINSKRSSPADSHTSPASVADTVLSPWLPTFDDYWDGDAVPGLTASSLRKNVPKKPHQHVRSPTASSQNTNEGMQVNDASHMASQTIQTISYQQSWEASQGYLVPNLSTTRSVSNLGTDITWRSVLPKQEGQAMLHVSTGFSGELGSSSEVKNPSPIKQGYPAPLSLAVGESSQRAHSMSPVPRGVKRERPSSPTISFPSPSAATENEPVGIQYNQTKIYNWPVLRPDYSARLSGSGNLAVCRIAFSSDGSHFALSCADKTLRIWNNTKRAEIARLTHNSPIADVTWMEGDIGVVTLGEDGIVGKWTRVGGNYWQWAKIVDAGSESNSGGKTCLAYHRDRIAVSFPKSGVKVWMWLKGTWQAQRSIVRPNVTAIKFVDDGCALLGGTRDGILWYCEIPNGTLRVYCFLQKSISSLDMSANGSHALVGHADGCARLVCARDASNRGSVEVSYPLKEQAQELNDALSGYPGAVLSAAGQAVIFGSVEGCVLVWDRKKATLIYGLVHEQDDVIQAVSCVDGVGNKAGCIVTGTQRGQLWWWTPINNGGEESQKRAKLT